MPGFNLHGIQVSEWNNKEQNNQLWIQLCNVPCCTQHIDLSSHCQKSNNDEWKSQSLIQRPRIQRLSYPFKLMSHSCRPTLLLIPPWSIRIKFNTHCIVAIIYSSAHSAVIPMQTQTLHFNQWRALTIGDSHHTHMMKLCSMLLHGGSHLCLHPNLTVICIHEFFWSRKTCLLTQ